LFQKLRDGIENLFPGYFALVMATGIVSLAAHFLEMTWIALVLFWLNHCLFLLLVLLTVTRLALVPRRVFKDLTDHQTGPTFLTIVAGTCVFGTQHVVQTDGASVALPLWIAALIVWVGVIYSFLTSITIREQKPPLEKGLNGAWLLMVVSTQSLAVLGSLLAGDFGDNRQVMMFVALCLFLLGCMFYLLIITLIFYRFSFFRMTADELSPPYWINMGAVAITTMAGSRLLLNSVHSDLLTELHPFLKGFTLFFWVTATWWIPLLLILGDWRHVTRRVPLAYHPAYWSIVFPLGMYTAATFQLARALGLSFLFVIPNWSIYVALVAWAIVFVAMVFSVAQWLLTGPPEIPHDAPQRAEK
jgi:tellurite resistance protein TehA-like permease